MQTDRKNHHHRPTLGPASFPFCFPLLPFPYKKGGHFFYINSTGQRSRLRLTVGLVEPAWRSKGKSRQPAWAASLWYAHLVLAHTHYKSACSQALTQWGRCHQGDQRCSYSWSSLASIHLERLGYQLAWEAFTCLISFHFSHSLRSLQPFMSL